MGDWGDGHIPPLNSKEQLKSKWDDEDADENDVKESWEDEDEPAPAPAPPSTKPIEKAPKKSSEKAITSIANEKIKAEKEANTGKNKTGAKKKLAPEDLRFPQHQKTIKRKYKKRK